MPPEIALANRLLTQYSLETGGAGLSLGKRFVTTPDEYIDDDLRPYLIPDPNDPNKLGFYEDVVGKFARAKKLSTAASKKMGKAEALKAAETRLGSYASAESSISSFKKSGVLDISGSIRDYLISSVRNPGSLPLDSDEIENLKKKLTKTNLDAFEGLVGPEKIPVGVQGQRTKLSEVFGTILETYDSDVSDLEVDNITRAMGEKLSIGGLVSSFSRGGYSRSPSKLVPNDPAFERSQTSSSSGINYTSILENSGLNLQRELIDRLASDARTLGYTPDELLERAQRLKIR